MDREAVFQLLATKWFETAERVENRSLKRCYTKKALRYQAMAASKRSNVQPQQPVSPRGSDRRSS